MKLVSKTGASFIIQDQAQFASELLPLYFKHSNMASFIRQLNMYGFRKLSNNEYSGQKSERSETEFYHQYFVRGQEGLLEFIKRKVPSGKTSEEKYIGHGLVQEVLGEVKAIQNKQENVSSLITSLKYQNEMLWKEIAIQKQKHLKLQLIVEKLVHFLVSLVHPTHDIKPKRKLPLMITNEEEKPSSSKVSRMSEVSRDTINFNIRMSSENAQLSDGLTIRDITDSPDLEAIAEPENELTWITEISSPHDAKSVPEESTKEDDCCNLPASEYVEPLCVLEETDFSISSVLSKASESDDIACTSVIQNPITSLDNTDNHFMRSVADPVVLSAVKKEPESLESPAAATNSSSDFMLDFPNTTFTTEENLASNKTSMVLEPNSMGKEVALTNSDSDKNMQSFIDQLEGIETELDWLQQHLSSSSLSLDQSTMSEIFNSGEDFMLSPLSTNNSSISQNSSKENNGNKMIQYDDLDFNVPDVNNSSTGTTLILSTDKPVDEVKSTDPNKCTTTSILDLNSILCNKEHSDLDSEMLLSNILELSATESKS
ncbi:uncharacterized protein LOC143240467 isoform X2 [Tachypleus tridentatus]|uniref:uncharacterized protein LOC143240467 isoform X2 n=1 Tax=Tachypleus tridentatus TaxID=6853 RepID=UPI003FD45B52